MSVKIWHAKEATVKIKSSVTITTSAALDTFFSAGEALEAYMTDVSIKPPMGKPGKLDMHGTDTNGFQNAELEDKPADLAELKGTLVLPTSSPIYTILFGAGTNVPPTTATHVRYRPGKAAAPVFAILLNLTDGDDEVNFVLDAAKLSDTPEVKSTGADGHFEISITAVCLPRNFYGPELAL